MAGCAAIVHATVPPSVNWRRRRSGGVPCAGASPDRLCAGARVEPSTGVCCTTAALRTARGCMRQDAVGSQYPQVPPGLNFTLTHTFPGYCSSTSPVAARTCRPRVPTVLLYKSVCADGRRVRSTDHDALFRVCPAVSLRCGVPQSRYVRFPRAIREVFVVALLGKRGARGRGALAPHPANGQFSVGRFHAALAGCHQPARASGAAPPQPHCPTLT